MSRSLVRLLALAVVCAVLGVALRPSAGRRIPGRAAFVGAGVVRDLDSAAGSRSAVGGAATAAEAVGRVRLNRATQADLEGLPGIGPALARRILDFRASHGPFRDASELLLVRGIGPKKWAALRARVAP